MKSIKDLCAAYSVRHLYAFGSVLTDHFTADSDVDLLVDFYPVNAMNYADNYFDLKYSLEKILQRKVDLLEEKAITNPYFLQSISQKKQLVYGN